MASLLALKGPKARWLQVSSLLSLPEIRNGKIVIFPAQSFRAARVWQGTLWSAQACLRLVSRQLAAATARWSIIVGRRRHSVLQQFLMDVMVDVGAKQASPDQGGSKLPHSKGCRKWNYSIVPNL